MHGGFSSNYVVAFIGVGTVGYSFPMQIIHHIIYHIELEVRVPYVARNNACVFPTAALEIHMKKLPHPVLSQGTDTLPHLPEYTQYSLFHFRGVYQNCPFSLYYHYQRLYLNSMSRFVSNNGEGVSSTASALKCTRLAGSILVDHNNTPRSLLF